MAKLSRCPKFFSALLVSLLFTGCFSVERPSGKDAKLKEALYTMRQAIDQYTQDKNRAPRDLRALVDAGYLHAIPKDPFTNSSETWQIEREDATSALDKTAGIADIHSVSKQISSEGSPYSSW